jgi:acylphosphatase
MRKAVHVTVYGRVQGVGFRAFVEREAQAAGLDGWVRNRREGTVEAVIAGEDAAVEQVLGALRQGPPASHVREVQAIPHDAHVAPGFTTLPTE